MKKVFLILLLLLIIGKATAGKTGLVVTGEKIIPQKNTRPPEFPFESFDEKNFYKRLLKDINSVSVYRSGLKKSLEYVYSKPDIFPEFALNELKMLTKDQKKVLKSTWGSVLDYIFTLGMLEEYYNDFILIENKKQNVNAFLVVYASFLSQYRFAVEFIEQAENNPGIDIVLNESIEELGLPVGTYDRFKTRFLSASKAAEFVTLESMYLQLDEIGDLFLRRAIETDTQKILFMGKDTGGMLTLKNGINLVKKIGMEACFPLQKSVTDWIGDTKIYRQGVSLITPLQVESILPRLQPGDILLERREWYLSNVGLPGFWTHAALYVGTIEERKEFFRDTEVSEWVKENGIESGDFETLLSQKCSKWYRLGQQPTEDGHILRVLEAVRSGVNFTTIEHAADVDSFAVLRPRLSKKEKAIAIFRGYKYLGTPYDFYFEFLSDTTIVCTELIYKVYEPEEGYNGISFPLRDVMGRLLTTANMIAEKFDKNYGTKDQQLDIVLFLDGFEDENKAYELSVNEFRETWTRPKWHILVQDTPPINKH
ncbi:MAG: hypothetical protein KAI43_06560 [Candidatus Aureabacteria bacterium]|nr:hypothetical protein [Candidatus Auribacterota bacterium]